MSRGVSRPKTTRGAEIRAQKETERDSQSEKNAPIFCHQKANKREQLRIGVKVAKCLWEVKEDKD